jgi:hypothetical protein
LRVRLLVCLLVAGVLGVGRSAHAQDTDGPMSEAEVEALRESAYIPMDRMRAFEKILDAREKRIDDLVAKTRRPGFAQDMHDAMEQFGQIADEFNDNLDELGKGHRDVRKELPKLIKYTERWASALRAPADDDGYSIVKKIALNDVKDMREIAEQMLTEEEVYFKAHPEAVAAEKARVEKRE